MTTSSLALLVTSTTIFVCAASTAKAWAIAANGGLAWLAATLTLYTAGNLIMLRLIRDVGMGVALSLSAVVQLFAVNVVAIFLFGERVSAVQAYGLLLAIVAVAMITLAPAKA